MNDIIQCARLADLAPTVGALPWPSPAYMYLERVPESWLPEAERTNGLRLEMLDLTEQWGKWERGRLFCQAFELHWEASDGAFQTVFVGESMDLPEFQHAADLDLGATTLREDSYILWGKRVPQDELARAGLPRPPDPNVFVEFIVPRVLHYPVSGNAARVRLRVRSYVDLVSGEAVYNRFCGLEEVTP